MSIETTKNIILTDVGTELKELAVQKGSNTSIQLAHFAIGDANGLTDFALDTEASILQHEIWRGDVLSVQMLEGSEDGTALITAYVPASEAGPAYFREFGIFDKDNNLIFFGKLNNYYKHSPTNLLAEPVVLRIKINWGYAKGLTSTPSASNTLATIGDVNSANNAVLASAFRYFMSGNSRRAQKMPKNIMTLNMRRITDSQQAKVISSGDYLLVAAPMTIKLPLIQNGVVHVKCVYKSTKDFVYVTTEDPDVNKIDGEKSIPLCYLDSYALMCDGTHWYMS